MKYKNDKAGSKIAMFVIVFVLVYLSFFKFDINKAYEFTVAQNIDIFKGFFQKP